MKIKLLLLASFFSLNNYSQGCVDRVVTSDDMTTVYLLNGTKLTWGRNQYGQLGNGTTTQQNTPNYTINNNQWLTVDHASMHTIALKQDHTAWAWGNNAVGQLGNGTLTDSFVPVQVGTDSDWQMISAGNLHSAGLKTNGTLWGWGNNGANELAQGYTSSYQNPIQIGTDSDWAKVYAGYFKTYAIKTNGTLWGKSRNDYRDLGIGNLSAYITPVQIGTDTDWAKISGARQMYTLALKTNGKLWGWGNNEWGRIGDGTTNNRETPVQIGTDSWKDVAAGNYRAVGIKADGTLWHWGSPLILTGDTPLIEGSNVPVQVGTDNHWKSVVAGFFSNYAVRDDNTLWTWGYVEVSIGSAGPISSATPILIPCEHLNQQQFNQPSLVLYPNPVKNILNLDGITNLQSYEVVDMLGQIVLKGNISENTIDLSALSNGIYIGVFHTSEGQVFNTKFSKE